MLVEDFIEVENALNLLDRKYKDFPYWIYSRYAVFSYITKIVDGIELSSQELSQGLFGGIMSMLINSLIFWKKCKSEKDKDILILNHERKMLENNKYVCLYTEKIAEQYQKSVVFERPYNYRHLKPAKTDNIIYGDYIELCSLSLGLLSCLCKTKKYRNSKKFFLVELKDIVDSLQNKIKAKIEINDLAETITRLYLLYCVKKKIFNKMLSIFKLHVIIEVVSYNMNCMIINELAAESKIPTIELQHGVMSGSIAYNYPMKMEIKQFPDYIFVFSEFWKKSCQFPIEQKNIKVVGYPYLEEKAKQYSEKLITKRSRRKETVLFLSQWTIGKELSKMAVEFSELSKEQYEIIFKLHPGEYETWRKNYPWLEKNKKIRIIDSLEHNIYECFAMSDYQVGVSSTAIYEGLEFALKTFIYKIKTSECMKNLCDDYYASYVSSAQDLYEKISEKNYNENNHAKNGFWEKDSLKKIIGEINDILDKNEYK